MSGLSPARRLRTKTSELSDFFRGTSHSSHQSRQASSDVQPHSSSLSEVPPMPEPASSTKRRNSRIPFLGRTRKKSAQSDASSLPSTSEHELQESAPPVGTTSRSFADGHTVLMISPEGPSSSHPSTLPPINVSPPSLGSKFAAHFTSSKPQMPTSSPRKPGQPPSDHTNAFDSLLPPSPSPRPPSFDSTSSGTSRTRSPTPRPSQPTITVSLSSENLEEYGDLFTLPRQIPAPKNSTGQAHLLTPRFEHVDNDNNDMDTLTPSPSPPTSPRMQFPIPPFNARRPAANLKDTDTTLGRRDSRGFVYMDEKPSVRSSKGGKQHPVSVVNELEVVVGTKMDLDPPEESEENDITSTPNAANLSPVIDISPWNHNQKRRSVATMPYKSDQQSSSSPRSIMKPPSTFANRPNGPPTIPLPPPPPTNPPLSSMPTITSPQTLPSRKSVNSSHAHSNGTPRRPRAHTTSSVPNFPRVTSPSSSSSSSVGSSPKVTKRIVRDKSSPQQNPDKDNLGNATLEQLRQALTSQNLRFDELASYLLKVTEKHLAEKTALEKKIELLEREAVRREKEIKGLTWLVVNNRGPGGPGGSLLVGTGARSASSLGLDQVTQTNQSSGLSRSALTERQNPDDSGTESRASGPDSTCGSGAESRAGSGTESRGGSGAESLGDSFIRAKKLRRNNTIESNSPEHRSSNLSPVGHIKAGLGFDFNVPDMPYLSSTIKRSSISSFSSSAASSTSSLSSPSPNATNVSSALSVIPEAPSAPPKSPWDPAVAAAILAAENQREKEERRASRAARRISSSSLSSSPSISASNNYATNLKRGRPPSIAQVLDQSPSIEHVLEKLQPFGGGIATPSAS